MARHSRAPWVMHQRWHHVLFAHWPVSPDVVRPLLPAGVQLDTWDGSAWIGVLSFGMSNIRPRFLPALPRLSTSLELNVRTYASAGDRRGVVFLSLDASNRFAVAAARTLFRLPYYRARQSLRSDAMVEFTSERTDERGRPASFAASYRGVGPVGVAAPGSLDAWLTERYSLFTTDPRGGAMRVDIAHRAWPLQRAEARLERNDMTGACGIDLAEAPPLLHYARRQDVVVWLPRPIRSVRPTP